MGKRIEKNIEENIVNRAIHADDYELFVFNETKEYNNQKRTGEILAHVATKREKKYFQSDSIKKDFVQNALNFSNKFNKKMSYEDPDKASVQLYKSWGEYLKDKGIIQEYKIIYTNYWFRLEISYINNENKNKTSILGSDGIISINKIRKGENIFDYKKLGGFMIWPSHRGGINFKKNSVKDRLDLTIAEIKKHYKKTDSTNFILSEDNDWFNYLGSFYRNKDSFESFCTCFELEEIEVSDEEQYYDYILDYINKRDRAMQQVFI